MILIWLLIPVLVTICVALALRKPHDEFDGVRRREKALDVMSRWTSSD